MLYFPIMAFLMLLWSRCTISRSCSTVSIGSHWNGVPGAMLHKIVWQSQAGYLWLIAVVAHPFEYGRSHSAHSYTIFYGHDALELLAHLGEDVFIQRLHESHIVVRNAHLRFLLYLFDCLDGIVSDRTDGEHGYIFSVFQLSATAATRITDHVASVVWQLG